MLAMPTASDGAPPVRANSVLSPISLRQRLHLLDGDREAPAGNGRDRGFGRGAHDAGAGVDGEVHARIQQRRGDHRHDADEGFERHAAVADQADVAFVGDQLRRGAARDQRMEAGDRAAGDGDEHERERSCRRRSGRCRR